MSSASPIDKALDRLGTRRMLLQVHDASFPGSPEEDVGRGTPYGAAGARLAAFARELGFTGIQFGPQGQTTRGNPSPYDGTVFSRSFLSISFPALRDDPAFGRLVNEELLERAIARAAREADGRAAHELAWDSQVGLCSAAHRRYQEAVDRREIDASPVARFTRENRDWLEPDAIYEALAAEYGSPDWRSWPNEDDRALYGPDAAASDEALARIAHLRDRHEEAIARYTLVQFLAHRQHEQFHRFASGLGLTIYADLQVGLSPRDVWRLQSLFLPGYRLGAPPSRTNREGQPWGYPVLDPAGTFASAEAMGARREGGPGGAYLRARAEKLFREFDGLRIDHPQGLVCPWVYRTDDADPMHAVQNGARLFSSPHLADHRELARYAIARRDQLSTDPSMARYADGWVNDLGQAQVDRFAGLLSAIMEAARSRGLESRSIACETLSTQPFPLKRVMEEFGLGRFRVTQKMDPNDPSDVYRTDNAAEPDWVMLGNHDTRPVWARAAEWQATGELGDRAAYLARRLAPPERAEAMRRELSADTGSLVQALFADLLLSKAENVVVFFADLLGSTETYNRPGTVGPDNWALRVRRDYESRYRKDASEQRALNVAHACALALRSPLAGPTPTSLVSELEAGTRQLA